MDYWGSTGEYKRFFWQFWGDSNLKRKFTQTSNATTTSTSKATPLGFKIGKFSILIVFAVEVVVEVSIDCLKICLKTIKKRGGQGDRTLTSLL